MSYFDELGIPFLDQFFNASNPIHRPPDLLRKKIFDLLSFQRLDCPMIEDGNLEVNFDVMKDL
jgi:hypothetical protein